MSINSEEGLRAMQVQIADLETRLVEALAIFKSRAIGEDFPSDYTLPTFIKQGEEAVNSELYTLRNGVFDNMYSFLDSITEDPGNQTLLNNPETYNRANVYLDSLDVFNQASGTQPSEFGGRSRRSRRRYY